VTLVEDAIRSWLRLDAAFAAVNAELTRRYGVTGGQLGMLRLIAEFGGRITLARLRQRLSLHPATLGQLVARLAEKGLVEVGSDPHDRRRRLVELTAAGGELIESAPLVGPVRLRTNRPDDTTLICIAEGFQVALEAFGLTEYATERNLQ
jgi:DNA-binding MarR family transcriptional regulator